MGSAGTAFIQDASSVFFNPEGISFLNKNQVTGGMTPTFSNGTFVENLTTESARTTSPVGIPFALYGAFKLKDSSDYSIAHGLFKLFV